MSMVRPTEVGDAVEVVTDVDVLLVADGVEAVASSTMSRAAGVGVPPEHAASVRAAATATTAGPNHAGDHPTHAEGPTCVAAYPLLRSSFGHA